MRLIFGILMAAACVRSSPPPLGAATGSLNHPDSVVLERTPCYGTCPAYRLRVSRGGDVAFESRNAGETRTVASGSVAPAVLDSLYAGATASGLLQLPDSIVCGSPLFVDCATDHPTMIVGCMAA